MRKVLVVLLSCLLGFNFIMPTPVLAEEMSQGAEIFAIHCAGCHPQGGNIIRWGKTLQKKALKKYKMDSLEAVEALITHGKNNMSAFGDRLSPEDIKTVASYVLEQAEKNWK